MTVSLVQWLVLIDIFNCQIPGTLTKNRFNLIRNFGCMLESLLLFYHYLEGVYITIITFLCLFVLLLCHGDIEPNPDPKIILKNSFSVCHWNVNSFFAHDFSKLTQLKAYISMYKHDLMCLSETYLDSSTPDDLVLIDECSLVRVDHPNNIKRGGVCI